MRCKYCTYSIRLWPKRAKASVDDTCRRPAPKLRSFPGSPRNTRIPVRTETRPFPGRPSHCVIARDRAVTDAIAAAARRLGSPRGPEATRVPPREIRFRGRGRTARPGVVSGESDVSTRARQNSTAAAGTRRLD